MPTMITTEVYTLDELQALGDERAVERALDWMHQAWSDDAVVEVSDLLNDTLAEVFGPGRLTYDEWDYDRNYVSVQGTIVPSQVRSVAEGYALHGLSPVPGSEYVSKVEYMTPTANDYGRSDEMWLWLNESAPFGWMSDEYDALCKQIAEWISDVEDRLNGLMQQSMDYLLSRERMVELCEINGYTFTADGKRFG